MEWADIAAQAQSNAWVTAFSTTGPDGRPHVVFVAPGLGKEGHAMVATWRHTRKALNATATGHVAMHWPVGDGSLPPVFMRGQATVHSGAETVKALWKEGGFTWDIDQFFSGGFDNPDLVIIDVEVSYVSTHDGSGPQSWRPAG